MTIGSISIGSDGGAGFRAAFCGTDLAFPFPFVVLPLMVASQREGFLVRGCISTTSSSMSLFPTVVTSSMSELSDGGWVSCLRPPLEAGAGFEEPGFTGRVLR
jgi:hypothetical protein